MTNAEKFERLFGLYATELWSKSEKDFLAWLNEEAPAQPEQKKGKWIRITQDAIPEKYMCPFCRRTVESYGVEELLSIRYPFCNCGVDMRGENNE